MQIKLENKVTAQFGSLACSVSNLASKVALISLMKSLVKNEDRQVTEGGSSNEGRRETEKMHDLQHTTNPHRLDLHCTAQVTQYRFCSRMAQILTQAKSAVSSVLTSPYLIGRLKCMSKYKVEKSPIIAIGHLDLQWKSRLSGKNQEQAQQIPTARHKCNHDLGCKCFIKIYAIGNKLPQSNSLHFARRKRAPRSDIDLVTNSQQWRQRIITIFCFVLKN